MSSDRRVLLGTSLAALLLAGCGDLPQPFRGNPGAEALRLAAPPPARLAVATPTDSLLSDAAARDFASDLASDLQDNDIPAEAKHTPDPGDWRLMTRAENRGGHIVPIYAVLDPKGKDEGHAEGAPVPLADWAGGSPATLKAAAVEATPKITDLLRDVEAARMRSDPHSLYNRPAKVFVPAVTGAPGDGDRSLTVQMRRELVSHGEVVQETNNGADFTVAGYVNAVPVAGGLLRVEIQWRMSDAAGHDLGMVLQLNEVTPDTVRGYWGDVAQAVAREAAGGVHETLLKDSGHRAPQASASPTATPASATSATATPVTATPTSATPASVTTEKGQTARGAAGPGDAGSGAAAASVPSPPTARIPSAPRPAPIPPTARIPAAPPAAPLPAAAPPAAVPSAATPASTGRLPAAESPSPTTP